METCKPRVFPFQREDWGIAPVGFLLSEGFPELVYLAGNQKCALGSLGNTFPFPHRPSWSFSGVSSLDSGILEVLAVSHVITRDPLTGRM